MDKHTKDTASRAASLTGIGLPGAADPKAILINRINNYLNIAIGTVTGTFAGNAWATVRGFLRDPGYYLSKPGAWYRGLVTSGITAAVAIAAISIAKKIIKDKLGLDLAATSVSGTQDKTKVPPDTAEKTAGPVSVPEAANSKSSPGSQKSQKKKKRRKHRQ